MNTVAAVIAATTVFANIFQNIKNEGIEAILAIFTVLFGWRLFTEFKSGQMTKFIMTLVLGGFVFFILGGPEIVGEWISAAYNAVK